MTDSCRRHEPELSALLDGELDAATASVVRAHVDACSRCAALLRSLRGASAVLRRWDARETHLVATHAFRQRVLEHVGAGSALRDGSVGSGRLLLLRAAAAALVLLATGAGIGLAVSRSAPSDPAEIASLRVQFEALRDDLAAYRAQPAAASGAREPASDLERLAPWDTVVTPREDSLAFAPPDPADRAATHEWEEHGSLRLLQGAFPEYDRFLRERGELALREDVRRLKALASRNEDRPTTDPGATTPLGTFLGALSVAEGPFAPYEQLQVWPIELPGVDSDIDVALDVGEALPRRVAVVTEGTEDSVVVENADHRGRPVLILAGDVLHGGRHDRIATEDVLLQPGQKRSVRAIRTGKVNRYPRRTFKRSDGLAFTRVRALLADGASKAEIDGAVADGLQWLGVAGGRGSLDDVFGNDQLLRRADLYVRMLAPRLDRPRVVGFAIAAGNELLGVEVFGDHDSFAALSTRVLRSHVIEALARSRLVGNPPSRGAVTAALAASRRAADAAVATGPAAFIEPESGLFGHGLVERGHVHHAVIYSASLAGTGPNGSRRRRAADALTGGAGLDGGTDIDGSSPPRDSNDSGAGGISPGENR